MIIVCPSCSARFAVKAEAIGVKGRKVKCAKCANAWFQAPDEEALKLLNAAAPPAVPAEGAAPAPAAPAAEVAPEVAAPIPEGSNVPVVQKEKSKPKIADVLYLLAASVVFLFILSLVSANSILPKMAGYYSFFGLYDSKELALSDVSVQKIEDGDFQDLLVSGKIVNQSDKPKRLPNLRITIYGTENETLKSITLDSGGKEVAAGEGIDFENRLVRIPKISARVVMDLGNKMDLAAR